jgi:putative DNA primase/helicase
MVARIQKGENRYQSINKIGEILTCAQFKKQLQNSDYYLDSNVTKRMGSDVRKVWLLNYELLSERCDVSGFQITEVEPLK